MERILKCLTVGLMMSAAPMALAQTAPAETGTPEQAAPATETAAPTNEAGEMLTQTELENLVAPVALYPDTLLIQVLVAATYPLDIIKADRFLADNAETDPETLTAAIEAEGYDMSVEVLATAFPDVLRDMAANVEWTETIGTAMLADSDAVLTAVQTMRDKAVNSGALTSGPAQTVEVEEDNVIITPTDPQVVYVPQYDTKTVYVEKGPDAGDVLGTALITFGTFALINEIFHNDSHWNGYWGCRNCGGWGGRPIIVNPRVRINNGRVNIGNDVNIGNRPNVGWKPEPRRQQEARRKIASKRGPGGATTMPVNRRPSRGDAMRSSLSRKSGAPDISRPGANRPATGNRPAANRPGTARPAAGARPPGARPSVNRPSSRPASAKQNAIARTNRKPAAAKPPVRQPAAKPAKRPPAARAPVKRKPTAMKPRATPQRSRAASSRGRASGARSKGRR